MRVILGVLWQCSVDMLTDGISGDSSCGGLRVSVVSIKLVGPAASLLCLENFIGILLCSVEFRWRFIGGIFALRAHCALLLDYLPPEEPPSTPLGNALRIR